MRARRLRAVIIGCGRIAGGYDMPRRRSRGKVRTHIKAYRSDPRFEVTAVCDQSRAKAETFQRHWRIPRAYTDISMMIQRERPDVVSVCTPTSTHARVLREAARAPVKLIFAEKPLTGSLREARGVANRVRRKRMALAVNYLRRWCPNHVQVKRIIESRRLGRLRCVDGYYSGDLLNIGSHLVDLIDLLAGPIAGVRGRELCLKSGAKGILQKGRADDFILELLFDRGLVRISRYGYRGHCLRWQKSGGGKYRTQTIFRFRRPALGLDSAMKHAVKNIGDWLLKRRPLSCGAGEALRAHRVLSALRRAGF